VTKKLTGVLVILLALFVGHILGQRQSNVVHAQVKTLGFSIPSILGHCKGSIPYAGAQALIFEADNGTITLVNTANGAVVAITRQ
jgi:hypothetical protein